MAARRGRHNWWLYQFFTTDGQPLYTGETRRPRNKRWAEHARHERTRDWWPLVDHQRTIVTHLGHITKRQALAIEQASIKQTPTLANNEHNRDAGRTFTAHLRNNQTRADAGIPPGMPGDNALDALVTAAPYLWATAVTLTAVAAWLHH